VRTHLAAALAAFVLLAACDADANDALSGYLTADNYFFAYISTRPSTLGTLIGSGTNWGSTYALTPTTLTPGTTYYLNIEAINGDSGNYSAGGVLGDFQLTGGAYFSNGTQQLLTGASGWVGDYNDSNNGIAQQPWVAPTGAVASEGANGIAPWGTFGAIASAADWIWPTDSQSSDGTPTPGNQCAACAVDFQTEIFTSPVPEPCTLAVMLTGVAALGGVRRIKAFKTRSAANATNLA
jgi:hypothetical protein